MDLSKNFLNNREDLRQEDILSSWRLLLSDTQIQTCVKSCANYINSKFKNQDLILVCILKGAVYFFVDLTKLLIIPYSTYFIEASSYKNNQAQSDQVQISQINPEKFINKTIILIDELFDSGKTINGVKTHIIQKTGSDKIFVITLFQKIREIKFKPPDFVGLLIPDLWLVGYGLDDRQEKRGWTHLYAIPKLPDIPKTEFDTIFISPEYYGYLRSRLINNIPKI